MNFQEVMALLPTVETTFFITVIQKQLQCTASAGKRREVFTRKDLENESYYFQGVPQTSHYPGVAFRENVENCILKQITFRDRITNGCTGPRYDKLSNK